jgi:hypothetical protein
VPDFIGGPCRIRTCDQRIKSPLLYLTELTALNDLSWEGILAHGFTAFNPFARILQDELEVVWLA